jgi:hypothetical protein
MFLKTYNKILDNIEEMIMPTPIKDSLYQAVEENNILSVKYLLINNRKTNLLDREVAYDLAVYLNHKDIAFLIRSSYVRI